jgi:hypothetical protein
MGYSEDESMVRVDFFKPSGKWYTTEAVKWTGMYGAKEQSIQEAFAQSLNIHLGDRLCDMDAVCLDPYHELAHPIQIKAGSWRNYYGSKNS